MKLMTVLLFYFIIVFFLSPTFSWAEEESNELGKHTLNLINKKNYFPLNYAFVDPSIDTLNISLKELENNHKNIIETLQDKLDKFDFEKYSCVVFIIDAEANINKIISCINTLKDSYINKRIPYRIGLKDKDDLEFLISRRGYFENQKIIINSWSNITLDFFDKKIKFKNENKLCDFLYNQYEVTNRCNSFDIYLSKKAFSNKEKVLELLKIINASFKSESYFTYKIYLEK